MNIQLINPPNKNFNATEQVLFNRGIAKNEIPHYLNLTDTDINEPDSLGEDALKEGVKAIVNAVQNNLKARVIVDCDCDGYTSGALVINYLYKLFPAWVSNNLSWSLHDGKNHGLSDQMDLLLNNKYDLVICPDSSSNDYECHKKLKDLGTTILILDHHLAEKVSSDAIVINNQLSDYPNKELSGVGVAWQFCRYIDRLLHKDFANDFLDLVAIGNCGDMMSLLSYETRRLITKGLSDENIKNPFIDYMIDKNNFALNKSDYVSHLTHQKCTSIGAAFFIVPFINAITRSGTAEEKELIFKSMLNHTAFEQIPEIKRNQLTGKNEPLVQQAIRVITNVKNRQTRAEEKGLELLEHKIEAENLLQHKILLFLVKLEDIEPAIRGLVANKFVAKYQMPCAILTRKEEIIMSFKTDKSNNIEEIELKEVTYEGSMRGYTKTGILSFKDVLKRCPGVLYVEGHDNAAGLGISATCIDEFIAEADRIISEEANTTNGPVHRVDYVLDENSENINEKVLEIAALNDYWGQDVDRAFVAIRFKVNSNNFSIMKSNTLKITLNNGLSLMKFKGTDEDIENFSVQKENETKEIEAYCSCSINEWMGNCYPQLMIKDYEVIDYHKGWTANMF